MLEPAAVDLLAEDGELVDEIALHHRLARRELADRSEEAHEAVDVVLELLGAALRRRELRLHGLQVVREGLVEDAVEKIRLVVFV